MSSACSGLRPAAPAALVAAALLAMTSLSNLAAAQCTPSWQDGYVLPGLNGVVRCSVTFDDGNGPKLYVGGDFTLAGSTRAIGVARWNGSAWESVGGLAGGFFKNNGAVVGSVHALAAFNGELYAGGDFNTVGTITANNIAKWNGTTWQSIGAMLVQNFTFANYPVVNAMIVHNDGSGNVLYVTGLFDTAGGMPVKSIARFDGNSFSAVGVAPNNGVGSPTIYSDKGFALASYNGDLYVGGQFTSVGTVPNTAGIVKWNGSSWSSVGSIANNDVAVFSMTVFDDDGAGPHASKLVAAGSFTQVGVGLGGSGGVSANNIASWDGSSWSPLDAGITDPFAAVDILSVAAVNTPSGQTLYATGTFNSPLNRWNGTNWSVVPGVSTQAIYTLDSFDFDGAGSEYPKLVLGGLFWTQGNQPAVRFATFDGTSFGSLPADNSTWTSDRVSVASDPYVDLGVAVGDEDGAGPRPPAIYAYGTFVTSSSTSPVPTIARKDGDIWNSLPGYPGGVPTGIVFYDDGTGTKLFAVSQNGLSRWDGSSWTQIPGIIVGGSNGGCDFTFGAAKSITVFDDDGAGPHRPAIYVYGPFGGIGLEACADNVLPAAGVARWDGTSWSAVTSAPVPDAVDATFSAANYAILPYNGALYAAGVFVQPDTTQVKGVAKWDGTAWTMIGLGVGGGQYAAALAEFQGKLYVGGEFNSMGTAVSPGIASWDGANWSDVGTGTQKPSGTLTAHYVHSLGVGNDGAGEALFLGGRFGTAGSVPGTRGVAKWNGSEFMPLATGIIRNGVRANRDPDPAGDVIKIASLDNSMFFTGNFTQAGSIPSNQIAQWEGCTLCAADFNSDSVVDFFDYLDFVDAFSGNLPTADFNHDTLIDFFDYLDFVDAFSIGC